MDHGMRPLPHCHVAFMEARPSLHDPHWSGSEKKLARRAFYDALDAAMAGITAECKARAAAVAAPFDDGYSQLSFVFAQLICLGHLDEEQLAGLSDEKLEIIRDMRSRMRRG